MRCHMPLPAAESPHGVLGRARPFAKRPPGSNSYGKVVLIAGVVKFNTIPLNNIPLFSRFSLDGGGCGCCRCGLPREGFLERGGRAAG